MPYYRLRFGSTGLAIHTRRGTSFDAPCDVIDESFFGSDEPAPPQQPAAVRTAAGAPAGAEPGNDMDDLLPLLDDPDEV